MGILLTEQAQTGMSGSLMLVYLVFIVAMIAMMIIPSKKEKKRMEGMLSSLEVGDSVLTTSGFYGMIIDIDEENKMVIVEFGSNKNCRIPMNMSAISQVEKPDAE